MKYLKTYENNTLNLQVDDYILVKTADNRINNEIMRVKSIPDNHSYFFVAELPDYFGDYHIYYSEVIKKLTPEEMEIHKNVNKYNL